MTNLGRILAFFCIAALAWPAARGGEEKASEQTREEEIFELTNQERKKEKKTPLKLSPALTKIARAHSENMARQGKMEHVLDKKSPFDRMRAAGYKFMKGGENIAMGDEIATMPMIMKAWMESKAHRDNILVPEFTEIGVGIYRKDGQFYFTQLFAKPKK